MIFSTQQVPANIHKLRLLDEKTPSGISWSYLSLSSFSLNAGDLRYGINETVTAFEKVLHLYKSGLYLQKRPLLLKGT